MKKHIIQFLIPLLFFRCIGTDVIDEIMLEPKIVIDNPLLSLKIGDSHQFLTQYFDSTGEMSSVEIEWQSSDPAIISITSQGLATAHNNGEVTITASTSAISIDILLTASENTEEASTDKTGTFSGSSGYTAVGTATLKEEDGEITLDLSADFKTSFALGTFIYLSNSTSGSATRSGGLELGEISSNGARSFDVTSKNATTTLDTYQYVIVLCKPASITFGSAELK